MSMGRWVEGHPNALTITVGPGKGADIRGKDNVALQAAVEKSAAMMTRNCMPRMLERERLACAMNCAWLAVQAGGSCRAVARCLR